MAIFTSSRSRWLQMEFSHAGFAHPFVGRDGTGYGPKVTTRSGGTALNGHHNLSNSRNEKICLLLLSIPKN
nr:hypothetical protein [uncultured Roseibium sp.]